MSGCPLDYSLCDRTVTVYRRQGEQIIRQVVENCYLSRQETQTASLSGRRETQAFLLIVPGKVQRVFPGDRVYDGVGPEVSLADWSGFLPVKIPGLCQVSYVQPCYWAGEICHVEAGRK